MILILMLTSPLDYSDVTQSGVGQGGVGGAEEGGWGSTFVSRSRGKYVNSGGGEFSGAKM